MRAGVLMLVALALSPARAIAGEDDDRARARTLVDEGNAFFEAKAYPDAIQRFEAALAIFQSPKIHVNLAEAHRAEGRLSTAMFHYEHFMAHGSSKPKVLLQIKARAAEIESKLGRIELVGAMPNATVTIESRAAPWVEGRRIAVMPGRVVVTIQRESDAPYEDIVNVEAGGSATISITPPIDLSPAPPPPPPSSLVATTDDGQDSLTSQWWFWTGIAVVVVAVTVVAVATTGGDDYLPEGELLRTGTSEWQRL